MRSRKALFVLALFASVGFVSESVFAMQTTAQSKSSSSKTTHSSRRSSKKASEKRAKVDLNNASEAELESLPGVGPATAKKIIAARPYASEEDLSKAGVPARTINSLSGRVTVSAPSSSNSSPNSQPPSKAHSPSTPEPKGASGVSPSNQQGGPGMVWVNEKTKVFHRPGDRWYGKTKSGKYMTETDAIAAGYRESKEKPSSK